VGNYKKEGLNMKKILVTGVNGFVGLHLAKELNDNGYTVIGVGGKIGTKDVPDNVEDYNELDLTDPEQAAKIDFNDIDGVVHLAGLAAVGPSFDSPMLYVGVNVGIEVNLFETALKQNVKPKFLIISSGTLYDAKADLPLKETSPVDPNSPYAVSKLGQEEMAMYYETRGFECVIARPFNHIGPGQGLGFIVPDLSKQVVDYQKGLTQEVLVGNLEAQRDYTDVRDIARAYRLLLEKGESGELYNVCSGKALSGHQILDELLSLVDKKPEVKQDPTRLRPSDTPVLYGSNEKISEHTGWQPEINISQTLKDVMDCLDA
jgi:GDP-4-dehydro-6-deoxy-D-mannose reductase